MGTVSRALVYLASIPLGMLIVFIAASIAARFQGPACTSGACDGGPMSMAFSALVVGPLVGVAIGYGACRWFERGSRH